MDGAAGFGTAPHPGFFLRWLGRGDAAPDTIAGNSAQGFAYRLLLPGTSTKGAASATVVAHSSAVPTARPIKTSVTPMLGDAKGVPPLRTAIPLVGDSAAEHGMAVAPDVVKPPVTIDVPAPEVPFVPKPQKPLTTNHNELSDDDLDQVSPGGYSGSGFALFRHFLRQSLEAQLNGESLLMPDHTNLECRFKLLMSRKEIQLRAVKCGNDAQFERLQALVQTEKLPNSFDFGLGPAVVTVRATGNGQIRMD